VPDSPDPLLEVVDEAPVVARGDVVQGKYRVGTAIGIGGMATVFAAHHLELDQPVAIKLLLPEHAARPDAVRRFLAEARAAARLKSEHVARVLDVGTTPTKRGAVVPFMVMERLEGCDLDGVLQQRGRLPVAEAVEYVLQTCDAVAEAHALGIIHRDLKPGNLFLTMRRDGTPVIKLLDFGISKVAARGSAKSAVNVTADREMMGSPGYMSPEQVRSSKDVDPRTDIWSLGVILYELLTGISPFAADNVADTLVAILHGGPVSMTASAPNVAPELVEVTMRCLQKKREARYATVEALAAALAPFRSATPIVVSSFVPRGDPSSSDDSISVSTVHEPPKGRVALTAALAFGAVGLVLIAIVGVARLRSVGAGRTPALSAAAAVEAAPPAAGVLSAASAFAGPTPTETTLDGGGAAAVTSANLGDAHAAATPKRPLAGSKAIPAKPAASAGARHRTDW